MTLKPPALNPAHVAPRTPPGYPGPFRSRVLPRDVDLGYRKGADGSPVFTRKDGTPHR